MRFGTALIVVIFAALAVGTSGCGKKRKDVGAEAAEGVAQADTANIDATGTVESLPTIDQAESGGSGTSAASAGSQTPAPPPVSGTGEITTYTVQKGDTLMKIAFNLYGDIGQWKSVYALNKDTLKSANVLEPGMQIKYDKPASEPAIERNGDPYLIKKGDTLGTIADDVYAKRSKWKKLWENNRMLIRDPNKIYAGFYLYYQITEEEKKEAEEIKAKRTVTPQLGTTEQAPDSAAVSPGVGKDALKGGGLDKLAEPPKERAPAGDGKQ